MTLLVLILLLGTNLTLVEQGRLIRDLLQRIRDLEARALRNRGAR